ncbi:unnamed protein product, partial [Aureobasidium uvarum]
MISLYTVVIRGFVLEHHRQFDQAISAHQTAIDILQTLMPKIRKSMYKVHRVMFERQLVVLQERKKMLDKAALANPPFSGFVSVPTILGADAELLAAAAEKHHLLSLQTLRDFAETQPKDMDREVYYSKAPDHIQRLRPVNVPKFAPTLDPSLPPTVYRISHDSELLQAGERSHWYFVKDETNTTTLYAMQFIWQTEEPIREAVLRRAGEFLPAAGALRVDIMRTPRGAYMLKMTGHRKGLTLEMPDRSERSGWFTRRFYYGGRQFVWKEAEKTRTFSRFTWNELYETSRVWPKKGSKTGKMDDEVVGGRLCWGENHGGMHENHTIYMAGGLDQHFREHLLASQLARLVCVQYPTPNPVGGIKAISSGATLLSIGAQLLSQ